MSVPSVDRERTFSLIYKYNNPLCKRIESNM